MAFLNSVIRFISVDLSDYKNIGIKLDIGILILFLFAAFVVVTAFMSYRRYQLINVLTKLIRHDAIGEENAKNLTSFGVKAQTVVAVMKSGGQYTRIFGVKGKKAYTYEEYSALIRQKGFKEEKTDYKTAEIYIKPESMPLVKRLQNSPPPTLVSTVIYCVIIVAVYLVLAYFLPDIVSYINDTLKPETI